MQTVEFKLSLNHYQQGKVNSWLNVQRWVWNQGLHLLEKFDSFSTWDKDSKSWIPRCPIRWEYYRDSTGQLIPFTRIAKRKPYRMSCPIFQVYRKPELESPTLFGLSYYFAQKNHLDKPWFCEVPSRFIAGTLKSLADAWATYKSGKRQHPRYKQYKDKFKTLINNNAKPVKVSGKQITLPKLGKVTVKTLDRRWLKSIPITTLKIVKEPSGYYLQLTGSLPLKKLKPSNKAVGVSLSHSHLATTDGGKVVETPSFYRKMEKRLKRLQRKLSRQQKTCSISTFNSALGKHFLSCPINPHKGANRVNTQQKISLLHEKIRRSRRATNHKISTYLVQEYGAIATVSPEIKNITCRPTAIVSQAGISYQPNGASHKADFNKKMLDNGLGQLTTLIEQKALVHGREFISVSLKDLPNVVRQRAEKCSKELHLSRTVYVASFFGRYRAWAWELTPGESTRTLNQEPPQDGSPCDAGTTSNSTSQNLGHCSAEKIPKIPQGNRTQKRKRRSAFLENNTS